MKLLRGSLLLAGLLALLTGCVRPDQSPSQLQCGDPIRVARQFYDANDEARFETSLYNHYTIELFFSGCKIEVIKVIERVTWL